MNVFYFGADTAWSYQSHKSLRRRNMAVLWAISEDPLVDQVYNVIRTTRANVLKQLFKNNRRVGSISNIYIAPILPEKGMLKSISHPVNKLILKVIYGRALSRKNLKNSVAWCYWLKGVEDFNYLGLSNAMVFDTDHNIIDDPNINENQKSERSKLLQQAATWAQLVLSSSRSMLQWFHEKGFNNTCIMMNGVVPSRINLEPRIHNKSNKIITYCGTLSKWIELDWLIKLASENPQWQLNIIGRNYKTDISKSLEALSNVKVLGFLNPEEVDLVLKDSDVCIGLYRNHEALDVNSMKIYDYLAQGKPVIVNNYHPYLEHDFNGVITVVNSYSDFISEIRTGHKINMDRVEEFLSTATWNTRVHEVFKILNC